MREADYAVSIVCGFLPDHGVHYRVTKHEFDNVTKFSRGRLAKLVKSDYHFTAKVVVGSLVFWLILLIVGDHIGWLGILEVELPVTAYISSF